MSTPDPMTTLRALLLELFSIGEPQDSRPRPRRQTPVDAVDWRAPSLEVAAALGIALERTA